MKKNCISVICAGFGGQGIMFMGKLLAQAGLNAGKNVTWMPSYGAEVRGGTAYSMIKISDDEIASPLTMHPDIIVAMNKPSLVKYAPSLKEGGLLISNKSLIGDVDKIKGVDIVNKPLTELAAKLGDAKIANMIATGIIISNIKIISLKDTLGALKDMLKSREDLFILNKKALEKGYKL